MNKAFLCLDCDADTAAIDEYYMVKNTVWAQANPKIRGMLCIGCLETRLRRKLNAHDFPPLPINLGAVPQSQRLISRITAL